MGGVFDEEQERSIGTTQITAGRDVSMITSEETHSTSHHDKSSFIGISAGIYQNVTSVGKTVENAVSAFEGGENNIDDIINASSGVSAVAGDAKTAITDTAGAYIGVGFMKQENNSNSFSLIHNSSMVNAAHDFTVQAGRDITMVGVQAEVGNDLTLDADRHINLLAAQNENSGSASGDSSGGFLGIAASVGINGMGFKPAYGYEQAEYAMNNQGLWHSTNNFAVGGNVNIQAGNVDKGIVGDITSEGTKIIGMGNFNNSDVTLSATGDVTLTGVVNEVTSSSSGSSFGISNGMYDNIFHGGEGSYVASAQGSDMTDLALHGVSQGLSFLGGTEGIVQGVMSGGNVSGGLFDGLGGLEGAIGGLGKGVDNLGGVNLNYSDYSNNSQNQHVDKGLINVGGNVSIESGRGGLSDGDINIIDNKIISDIINIDAAGNLTVETTPDTVQSSGDSFNVNVGSGGFGGGIGESTQDVNWTEDPAGIFGKSEVNIDVGDTTTIIGGAIVSETEGGLSLVTGKLEVEDISINDYARDEYTGVQVNVDVDGIVTGKTDGDIFNSNSYGSIEHSDVGHDKQGVVKGTISGGSVTVGGEILDVAALEDMGINTDADNIITITKDESWEESFKVDLINVGVVAEQVDNLVNVVESFTAKVPDHVLAQGKAAEDIYRRLIANGKEKDELNAIVASDDFQKAVSFRNRLESAYESGEATAETVYAQLDLELKAFANSYIVENCGSGTVICDTLLAVYGGGLDSSDLSSDDIFVMMSMVQIAAEEGASVAVNGMGISLHGEELKKAAIECASLWYQEVKNNLGSQEAIKQLKYDIENNDILNQVSAAGLDDLLKLKRTVYAAFL